MNQHAKNYQDDALIMVFLRNEFYKRKFYFALVVYLLSLIVIIILAGVLYYLMKHPTRPLYFVTDEVSRLIEDVPKQRPNMSTDEVSDWTVEAIEAAFTYDAINYRRQLQSAQKYFTDYGWRNYMQSLTASSNLVALTERKFIIIAKVVDKPKVTGEGLLGGSYAYKFQMPLLLTYLVPPYDDKSKFLNPILLSVIVQRQSILTSYRGLGILQMIGNLAVTPPPTTLATPPT